MLEGIFGLIAGIISGLGMGGGTILILLLTTFQGMEQHIAQATNLIFFVPTSIAAIIIHLKNKNIDKKVAMVVGFLGIIGAIIGAIVANNIDSKNLKKYFSIFILLIAIREIYTLYKEYKIKEKKLRSNLNYAFTTLNSNFSLSP